MNSGDTAWQKMVSNRLQKEYVNREETSRTTLKAVEESGGGMVDKSQGCGFHTVLALVICRRLGITTWLKEILFLISERNSTVSY